MEWKTIVDIVNILPDDDRITQIETNAAVELVRVIGCLNQIECISFDLDGHVIVVWDKHCKRTRSKMKEHTEESDVKENLTTETMFVLQIFHTRSFQTSCSDIGLVLDKRDDKFEISLQVDDSVCSGSVILELRDTAILS